MKKRRWVLKPRAKILIAVAVIAYFSFVFVGQELKMHQQYSEMDQLEEEIAEAESKNDELERLVQYTETPEYIEKVAREKLGWVKKGEIKFVEKKNEND